MSVILVVEQDAGYANRIANALRATGHVVNVVPNLDAANQSATLQPPQLVFASGSLPGAVELLERFSQRRGGPGSVVLLPVTLASQVQAADFRADEVLAKPYSEQDLFSLTGRLVAGTTAAPKATPRGQLTSADIFGDVLAEVEAEAQKSAAKKPLFAQDDIEKKLEETLSGVLATGDRLVRPGTTPTPPRPSAPPAPPARTDFPQGAPTQVPSPAAAPPAPQARPPVATGTVPPASVPPALAPPPTAAPGVSPPTPLRAPAPVQATATPGTPGQPAGQPAAPRPPVSPPAGSAGSILGVPFPQAAAPPRRPQASAREIDDLLDKTLSSLELPQRAAKRPGVAPPLAAELGPAPGLPAAPPRAQVPLAQAPAIPSPGVPTPINPTQPTFAAPPAPQPPAQVSPSPSPQPSLGTGLPTVQIPMPPLGGPVAPPPSSTAPSFAAKPAPTGPPASLAGAGLAPSVPSQSAAMPGPSPLVAPAAPGNDLMTVALPKSALAALLPNGWPTSPETPPLQPPAADLRGEPLEEWAPPSFTPVPFAPEPLIPTPGPAPSETPAASFESAFSLEAELFPIDQGLSPQATEAAPASSASPSFSLPSFEAVSFGATSFDSVGFDTPSFGSPEPEMPGFQTPSLETPSYEPANFDAPSYEPANFDAPSFSPFQPEAAGSPSSFPAPSQDFGANEFTGSWSVSYEEPHTELSPVDSVDAPADFVSAFAPPPETGSFVRPLRLGDTGKISTADFGLGAEADQGLQAALQGVLQMRGPAAGPADTEFEGSPFGEYRLLERVALGGMAEVWRARRRGVEGFQKTVAIKKILSHLTGSTDFITMFIDEAKLAAQLSHNNIIQIYDLGKVDDDFYIAMEYVEGKDLRTILASSRDQRMPLPLPLALMIIAAVARALDYAHRKRDFANRALGLVHRDVSPQNVLISYEGEIKLCDFGIVKAVAKASTTQMGALKGKLQYMSPEQAWGRDVDARSDIFSLGSVMFEVLTGTKLFTGDSEIGVLDAVRDCRLRSPRDIVPTIPEEIERIVRKALAKNPEDRYSTAGQMEKEIMAALDAMRLAPTQRDLAEHMHHLFHTSPPPKPPALDISLPPMASGGPGLSGTQSAAVRTDFRPAPPPKSSPLPWILGGVAALVLVAVILWMVLGKSADEATPEGQVAPAGPAATAPAGAPTGPTDPNQLRDLVNQELSEKQKKMQEDYERQKRELEEKLQRVQSAPPPPKPNN